MAESRLAALRSSVERLQRITASLDDAQLSSRAYPSEWTIADVLSHLGSGAVISHRRLLDVLDGQDTPDDVAQGVWDEWNAKTPEAKRADALVADTALLDALEAVAPDARQAFGMATGPLTLDFDAFVGMRLNEHVLHTWDIEVVGDPAATTPAELAEHVVGNLDLIARFTVKPNGDEATIAVATGDGAHGLTVQLTADAATVSVGPPSRPVAITFDADALVRLVYGRLDPAHTPAGVDGPALDSLRQVFPGP
jgi:uncharacterized protein (TIGR03083 family)